VSRISLWVVCLLLLVVAIAVALQPFAGPVNANDSMWFPEPCFTALMGPDGKPNC
jgi:hypothetical protein